MPRVRVGQNVTKITSGRQAQVSAITPTHAVLYWADFNAFPTPQREQTYVRLNRFDRANEWDTRQRKASEVRKRVGDLA